MEFFRTCPGCKRRFHIKLVDKKLLTSERRTFRPNRVALMGNANVTPSAGYRGGGSIPPVVTMLYEGEPVVVDIEDFRYSYKCKHCGHEWSEEHVERHREN